jgi:hypothetical protein
MTTLDTSSQDARLAELIADIDELLSGAPASVAVVRESGIDQCVTRIHQRLTESVRSQTRLVAEIRRVRWGLGEPVENLDGPTPTNEASHLPVATLGAPVRTTKRDYNYFDALASDLKDLRARERARHELGGSRGA